MTVSCPHCGEPVEPGRECPLCLLKLGLSREPDPLPEIPGLEIQEPVGRGGMGRVYRAVQAELGREVAVKVLGPDLAQDPEFVERFKLEARALAKLDHPNIVVVHDFGVKDGTCFLVMEYVEGVSLREAIHAGLPPEKALAIVPQICDALSYAHRHGVVHRDIKPENILMSRDGRIKIADFGLAKLREPGKPAMTRTGEVMGTPNYMAPEQHASLESADHRSDIYSLGVVFYEMLTGELPLGRFPPPSRRVQVDIRLDDIVLKALENRPERRYQKADDIKADVVTVRTTDPPPFGSIRFRKAIIVTLLLSLLGLLAFKYLVVPFLGPIVTRTSEEAAGGAEALMVAMFLVAAIVALFWLWMLLDCLFRDHRRSPTFSPDGEHDRIIWAVLMLVINVPAAILYFFIVKRRRAGASAL